MKRLKLILLIALLSFSAIGFGQCTSDDFLDKCAASLGTFTFIKSFNVEIDKSKGGEKKVEYSYVFSKGSNYMLIVCDQNIKGKRMIVNLYDRNHKLIVSSYNKQTKKFYPSISYPCAATGVYYMESVFESDEGGCGVNILGFSKQ